VRRMLLLQAAISILRTGSSRRKFSSLHFFPVFRRHNGRLEIMAGCCCPPCPSFGTSARSPSLFRITFIGRRFFNDFRLEGRVHQGVLVYLMVSKLKKISALHCS